MDWQQLITLFIVGLTVITFIWSWLRIRARSPIEKHCGCTGATSSESPPTTVLRARRGKRPQLFVKLK